MKKNKQVWTGIEDKTGDADLLESGKQEFFELPLAQSLTEEKSLDLATSRRDFLKYLGFGVGAATVAAGCDIPLKRAIPYVNKPAEIVPGVANYYASSFVNGGDYCAILVKTREGRPIKIEGNPLSSITKGGTSARAQASVLSLYDTNRFTGCGKVVDANRIEPMSWGDLDKELMAKMNNGSQIRIITNTVMSPSTQHAFKAFTDKFPNARVVTYDPVSSAAMLDANEQSFGLRMIPSYEFDKADVIVGINADFLGTWISPVEYAAKYVQGRKVDVKNPKMSRHVQIESGMTLTGSNADNRILVRPSEQSAAVAALHNAITSKLGGGQVNTPKLNPKATAQITKLADQLVRAAGRSLVVCGNNNIGEQLLVNRINDLLGNYGKTIRFANASLQRQGSDQAIQSLIGEMENGQVDVVIVYGANPAFDLPNAEQFNNAFAKVGTKISFALLMDETTAACNYIAPDHHQLESWGDVQPKRGQYSLIQPTIYPLFDTRQAPESLLRWAGSPGLNTNAESPYYEYLKDFWRTYLFPQNNAFAGFQAFWDNALHDGVVELGASALAPLVCNVDANAAAAKLDDSPTTEIEVSFYESVSMGAGQYNNNPWLQELPDPVNRCTWGNNLSVPIEWKGGNDYDRFRNVGTENKNSVLDIVEMEVKGTRQSVGAVPQFGQMAGTVAIALGYGREVAGRSGQDMGKAIGKNVYPWLSFDKNGYTRYFATGVEVSNIIGKGELASVQYHSTMGVTSKELPGENVDEKILAYQGSLVDRSIVFHANVKDVKEFTHDLEEKRAHAHHLNEKTLYPFDQYSEELYSQGHHWGMYIDLNACVGCGACAVSCMAENNIPVVGRHEVYRHHEMFWMQIDRYYYGDVESPNTIYQPRMCQHCDNAPCENVCPVAATNHSSEGLNQMAYNRCVGTRYCANNCPYKVRRFNWLDYTTADLFPGNQPLVNGEDVPFGADNLTRMVLNPDVTVRSRGVIEKCSFCVQRIQTGKLTAKKERRTLRDADVKTACQTACPTGAIVFGDQNNKDGELHENMQSPLVYRMLEEVNLQSSVYYSAKIDNRDDNLDA